jgi:hypothetical protein
MSGLGRGRPPSSGSGPGTVAYRRWRCSVLACSLSRCTRPCISKTCSACRPGACRYVIAREDHADPVDRAPHDWQSRLVDAPGRGPSSHRSSPFTESHTRTCLSSACSACRASARWRPCRSRTPRRPGDSCRHATAFTKRKTPISRVFTVDSAGGFMRLKPLKPRSATGPHDLFCGVVNSTL